MTVTMALVDFVPVILFLLAGMRLLHDMYHMMSKGAFALLSCGILMVFVAGVFKATWKLLYALQICDFQALNKCFFPMQSTGFVLGAIGMIGLLFFDQKVTHAAAVVPVYASSMPFVIFMILGLAGMWGALAVIAWKMKQKKVSFLLLISFVCMLGMGYLSSRDSMSAAVNWAAQGTNIVGMGLLLLSVYLLHKAGLEQFNWK